MAKEEKRYLWKTVELCKPKNKETGVLAYSLNDRNVWGTTSKKGWKLGKKRKTKNARICAEGFHGNRNPIHALMWNYGPGLALIEVSGDRDYDEDHCSWPPSGANKECYSEATLVGLWYVADVKVSLFRRRGARAKVEHAIRTTKPIAGGIPDDYEWTKYNKYKAKKGEVR